MADELHKLLLYIVEHPVMQNQQRESQLEATAVRDVSAEISAASQDQRSDAERLAPFFARGLKLAAESGGNLTVDDGTPDGNGIADAFARFLVAPNLATSQSEPAGDNHFRYLFEINWPLLRDLASRAGVDLDRALATR
jgi:hypothetical protein